MPPEPDHMEIRRELRLGRMLGEGGMGQIYEGFETGLGSHAAIKTLREELLDDVEVRERFEEEARIIASIAHPGCLPIYGWGIDQNGRPFYAMKLISGKTLTELLDERQEKVTSFVWRRRLLRIFQLICETVAYAHEQGIVHRDLKPDNVMLDPFGSVYVIDWGLAKHIGSDLNSPSGSRTLAGSVMGSPGYMAPEQADGKTADAGPEADVFALGVILYEILTGIAPFRGNTDREAMAHAIHFDPKPPHRTKFLISRSLSTVCMKALNKDPKKRYRSASGLADDIRAYNEGRAVAVVKPTLRERAIFWTFRDPVRAALTWAACIVVLTGLSVVGMQVMIDRRLAHKTMDTIALIDRDLVELHDEAADLRKELTTAGADPVKINQQLLINEGQVLLRQIRALNALRSVKQLRFIRPNTNLDDEARRRLFALLTTGADGNNAILLRAYTSTLLEEIRENVSSFEYSAEELIRLRDIHERASKAAGLQP